jgi:hypothetical protein
MSLLDRLATSHESKFGTWGFVAFCEVFLGASCSACGCFSQRVSAVDRMPAFSLTDWVLTFCDHNLTSFSSLDTLCSDGLAWRRGGGLPRWLIKHIAGSFSSPWIINAKIISSHSNTIVLILVSLLC